MQAKTTAQPIKTRTATPSAERPLGPAGGLFFGLREMPPERNLQIPQEIARAILDAVDDMDQAERADLVEFCRALALPADLASPSNSNYGSAAHDLHIYRGQFGEPW